MPIGEEKEIPLVNVLSFFLWRELVLLLQNTLLSIHQISFFLLTDPPPLSLSSDFFQTHIFLFYTPLEI